MEMFNEGGLRDEGNSVDPVSGNDVPIGSTKEEVRDDIPAMLSEGEFVFPADVVRYVGLERLMQLRQEAKMGLKQMEAMGQMGNSEEATMPDDMPFGPADLVILGKPQEDKPREMNQGGIATGIGGYQPSVFQNQVPMTAGFTPPSTIAPPTPTPAPTGGYIPSFVYNESIPTTVSGAPVTAATPPVQFSDVTGPVAPIETEFVPTAEKEYYGIQYINEATGEIRTFYFYQGNPVTPIPDGFVPYNPPTEDGSDGSDGSDGPVTGNGTDGPLGGAGVDTTSVRGDDLSGTKKRLEDMVRDQGGNRLSQIRKDFAEGNKAKAEKDLVSLYLQNEKTKSLMTALGLLNPVALVGRGFSQIYGKQLEKLMTEQGIEIPEIDAGFFENLKGAVSDITGTGEAQSEVYNSLYDPSDSPLTTVSDAKNMLTSNEARAYDNAVKTGNARVAEHYEMINNRLNKMKDYMEGKAVSGLSKFDEEQAEKMFKDGVKGLDTQTKAAFRSGISGDDPYDEFGSAPSGISSDDPYDEFGSTSTRYIPEDPNIPSTLESRKNVSALRDRIEREKSFDTDMRDRSLASARSAKDEGFDLAKYGRAYSEMGAKIDARLGKKDPDALDPRGPDQRGPTAQQTEDIIEQQRAAAKEAARKASRDRRKKKKTADDARKAATKAVKEQQAAGRTESIQQKIKRGSGFKKGGLASRK